MALKSKSRIGIEFSTNSINPKFGPPGTTLKVISSGFT